MIAMDNDMDSGNIRKYLSDLTKDAIKTCVDKKNFNPEINIETPADITFGHYSTNAAMVNIVKVKEYKNPREFADAIIKSIKKQLEVQKDDLIESVSVAGPGFINFKLSANYFLSELKRSVELGEKYGSSDIGKDKTVVIEYSSPNIAKEFSVGHLRSTIIGQALYNLYQFLGYNTIGENHLGDWGTQFAMIIAEILRKDLDINTLSVTELQTMYVNFNEEMKENPELKDLARDWFMKLEDGDETALNIWHKAVEISLKEFKTVYDILNVDIDNNHGESFYVDKIDSVIAEVKEKGLLTKSEGAHIIEFDDMPPLILIKSNGSSTYHTRDLAAMQYRIKKWHPEKIIYEVGAEQTLYFRQLFKAAELLGWNKSGVELIHVGHGLLLLDGKKMSTRKGQGVSLTDVLTDSVARAKELTDNSLPDDVAKMVGVGAIKYFDLSHHYVTNINFSWDSILNMEGNSGPYIQYTYARGKSILDSDDAKNFMEDILGISHGSYSLNDSEEDILYHLSLFPEVTIEAAEKYAPNIIAEYIYQLAQKYNAFYNKYSILKPDGSNCKSEKIVRLALTYSVISIIKAGLCILGIKVPNRM